MTIERDSASPQRYDDREVARILERATKLQEGRVDPGPESGLTLDELADVARQAGIDPAVIRRAAAEVAFESRGRIPSSRLLGAPLAFQFERHIEGELPAERYDDVVRLLRQMTGDKGEATLRDRGITWTTGDAGELSRRVVAVRVEDGRVSIMWEEKLTNLAGALFGGLGAGVGVGLGVGATAPLWTAGVTVLGIGAPVVIAGGCFALARSFYGRSAGRREAAAREAIDRVALLVEPTP